MIARLPRRTLLFALAATACAGRPGASDFDQRLAALEARAGGRLGVAIVGPGEALIAGWRADERFGMCSTFKAPLAGAVLREAAAGRLQLSEVIAYGPADMVPYAPVAGPALAEGRALTLADLAEAAQTTSDNVAANLLIRRLGGPAAVTALWRAMGDPASRLDRLEPELNQVEPEDPRDTTTPAAMARLMLGLCAGDLLTDPARARLTGWMIATKTGLKRLRAGLPADWRAGDKTGTVVGVDPINRYNDVAVIWPPNAPPHAVAAYYEPPTRLDAMTDAPQAVLAEVGRIAAAALSRG